MNIAVVVSVLLAATGAPGATVKPLKVLVLDVNSTDLSDSEKTTIANIEATHLAENAALEILSGQDLKQLVALQGQAQEVGVAGNCSDACMAELAGALGAGVVVATQVGKLGATLVVTLAVFDASKAKSVSRKSFNASSLDAVPSLLAPALDALMEPLLPKSAPTTTTTTTPAASPREDGPRVKELLAAQAMAVCTDPAEATQWWFCTAKDAVSENEFVRRYRGVTGAHDLDAHEENRVGAGGYVAPVALGAVALAGAGVLGGMATCTFTDACGADVQQTFAGSGSNGPPPLFGGILLGLPMVIGGGIGAALTWPDDAATDGTKTTHSLSEGEGRAAVGRYNDALQTKLRREFAE